MSFSHHYHRSLIRASDPALIKWLKFELSSHFKTSKTNGLFVCIFQTIADLYVQITPPEGKYDKKMTVESRTTIGMSFTVVTYVFMTFILSCYDITNSSVNMYHRVNLP